MPLSLSSLTTKIITGRCQSLHVLLEVFSLFVDNVRVIIAKGPFTAEDAQYYINRIRKTSKFTLKKIIFTRSDAHLDIRYSFESIPFDRIRRIPLTDSQEDRAVNN